MAFTGDLEHLNIFDIIQLLNTTRKSGTFTVKGSRGESRIIFSNGHIVGANHLNSKVRIGTVLVRMNAITIEDLELALDVQRNAGQNRKPLIATLVKMGKLEREEASKGLKKLIEMTIVELVGWTEGSFTLDTEAIAVSSECTYPISKMEQEISLDAQMVLMDALRIFDERERDLKAGKKVLSDEEFFLDVLPSETTVELPAASSNLTADDLGLGDLDHLERIIPQPFSVDEIFDPVEIHREMINELLAGFPAEGQEAFVSFLNRSSASIDARDGSTRGNGGTNAMVLVSSDELTAHSIMTVCKNEGVLVFVADHEEGINQSVEQCLKIQVSPIVVFDDPKTAETLSEEKILALRQQVKERFPHLYIVQMASPLDYDFALQSFRDGVRTVFPRPSREGNKATFIEDMIKFLEAFNSYVRGLFREQRKEPAVNAPAHADTVDDVDVADVVAVADADADVVAAADGQMSKLKERVSALRSINEPSAVSDSLLQSVSEVFERSISFMVHKTELMGENALGVYADRSEGMTPAAGLSVPLTAASIFREVIEKGKLFYGEIDDLVLKALLDEIGTPHSPAIMLLPMRSLGRTVTLTYADFGEEETRPVQIDQLEILADEAGLVLENVLYRKHLNKTQQK